MIATMSDLVPDGLFGDLPTHQAPKAIYRPIKNKVWTEHKAQLVARYLRYFTFVTKHGAYIDGFAAPKSPGVEGSWAAQAVMAMEPRWLREFFLCDIDPARASHLQALRDGQPTDRKRLIDIRIGDFNDTIIDILRHPRLTQKTATFALLDQYSFQCEWRTLEALAAHKANNKVELLYFLPTSWLGRGLAGHTADLDRPERWWGLPDWRALQGQKGPALAKVFSERIQQEFGYTYCAPYPIFEDQGSQRVMFHLIHATDHDEAPKLMQRAYRKVTNRLESEEQLALDLQGVRIDP